MGGETFSTCSQGKNNGAAAVEPPAFDDVVDLKKAKKEASKNYGALAAHLLRESGMKGEVTARLVNQVRRMEKIYGEKKLHDIVKAVRYDKFWVTQGLVSLMKQENIERVMNRDNKPEDSHPESHSTGIRREI